MTGNVLAEQRSFVAGRWVTGDDVLTVENPADETTRQTKCEVDGKVIVGRFNDALETGRVGRTMEMLEEFSETDCFGDIKEGLATLFGRVAGLPTSLALLAAIINRLAALVGALLVSLIAFPLLQLVERSPAVPSEDPDVAASADHPAS